MDNILYKYLITEKKWSGSISTKYTPPEGLFTQSAINIANQLYKDSTDLKQAMSRLNFYLNRAGKNIKPNRRKEIEKAKELIRQRFEKEK